MPKAYDYDLRCKVFEAIELNGMTPSEVSEAFGISRNTIHQWTRLKTETGDLNARPVGQSKPNQKIVDLDVFRAFVSAHPDKTQTELAQLWPDDISERTIGRALKRIGFTRKKRLMVINNEMSSDAPISVSN